ncbi:MAG TPA: hypothetical protein DDX85_08125 [Nitrospiraceae bacterium]|nr:hypothetical protein [Nitrospiraceae bacterium]
MQPIITTHDFFSLSSYLNYQLSGSPVNWRAVLTLMNPDHFSPSEEELIIETMIYLGEAYGQEKRVLGPFAVIHPIRAASLLSRASESTSTLDLLTTLLHDKNEDITENKYTEEYWQKLEGIYQGLIKKIDSIENWYLNERIHFLTRDRNEPYNEYLSSLITQARATPEIIKVKLADRLDNTLDLRMDLYEDIPGVDCYQVIFEALYTNTYAGPFAKSSHHTERKINGAVRLYELFKNSVFLSLLRHENIALDEAAGRLFDSLAVSSINEAQNIMLHIFAFHMRDLQKQKDILMSVMDYCNKGGIRSINVGGHHRLDGLFKNYFDFENKAQLKIRLKDLYNEKELMAGAAIAFTVIFTSFLNDRSFTIKGITTEGIKPVGE